MRTFWDERYSSVDYVYGKEPNAFFAEQISKINPGLILLPAEGEGRNAVYAASLGWHVHAFDTSTVARDKALNLAAENNLNILYAITDAVEFHPGSYKYDAIGLVFAHFQRDFRRRFFSVLQDCLAPGGRIIIEAFDKKQINLSTGGPKELSLLYSVEEVEEDFNRLETILLSQTTRHIEEGNGHNGTSEVVRYVGIKPA